MFNLKVITVLNDGNILMVRILDLTQDFESIKYDLEDLVNYKVI